VNHHDKIYVAGHKGLVGSALVRRLRAAGYENIITQSRRALDLCDPEAVRSFFNVHRPKYVFLAAALVGGIGANMQYPGEFILNNLHIQINVIDTAYHFGTEKLLFLGSSCIYPREAPQPIKEEALLSGPLESTNQAYAVAKLAGVEMLNAYRSQYGFRSVIAMPTNLYGPNDNYDPDNSHVLPALIRRFHEAKIRGIDSVCLWGTGEARREFLHSDDCAEACILLMNEAKGVVNVGSGFDMTIRELATLVAEVVGYGGGISFDGRGVDGTPRKLLDLSKLTALGWKQTLSLRYGVACTYQEFLAEGS
jgi:GDP-L-fucose synthase